MTGINNNQFSNNAKRPPSTGTPQKNVRMRRQETPFVQQIQQLQIQQPQVEHQLNESDLITEQSLQQQKKKIAQCHNKT
jgi:hypothetical protein